MKTLHQLGYAVGFVASGLLVAYGFFASYDQVRLGLAAAGLTIWALVAVKGFLSIADAQYDKALEKQATGFNHHNKPAKSSLSDMLKTPELILNLSDVDLQAAKTVAEGQSASLRVLLIKLYDEAEKRKSKK